MSKIKQKGMFWHCHHNTLLEYCYDYAGRVQFIKENKPKDEIKTRLRLFKPVKGKLPIAVVRAGAAYGKTWIAYDNKTKAACYKAVQDNMPAILKLHQKECPDCSWQNNTIFPND